MLALHVCQLQDCQAGVGVRGSERRHHGPGHHGRADQAGDSAGVPAGKVSALPLYCHCLGEYPKSDHRSLR